MSWCAAALLSPLWALRQLVGVNTFISTGPQDTELASAAAQGDRRAFGELVARHQSAACAVAYSVCGDFGSSEDIAQEAFVAAWKQLPELRDRSVFRAWLCGIVRQIALIHVRRLTRREKHGAFLTDSQQAAEEDSPRELAVSAEEKALLWRALDGVPETYRDPLVLFYREQQSIKAVATALGITEDAVKQRLSRGRTLLREQVAQTLEGVLGRTRPGAMFTASVIGALPPLASSAGIGAGLVKSGGAVGSGGGAAGLSMAMLGTVISGLVGVAGLYLLYLVVKSTAVSPQGRRRLRRLAWWDVGVLTVSTAAIVAAAWDHGALLRAAGISPTYTIAVAAGVGGLAHAALTFAAIWFYFRACAEVAIRATAARSQRYRSRGEFLGLPWIAIATGPDDSAGERFGMATGWIAIGDVARGAIAFGGVALGPIAVGGVSVGVVAIGGIAAGALALAGIGVGWVACAGLAVGGNVAFGGIALAWHIAIGGVAGAPDYALGGASFGSAANTKATFEYVVAHPISGWLLRYGRYGGWLSVFAVPTLFATIRRMRRSGGGEFKSASEN